MSGRVRQPVPGIGVAVANSRMFRESDGGDWGQVGVRVAAGNVSILGDINEDEKLYEEYANLRDHISAATVLLSGRHLQHGDITQPEKTMNVFTNCSVSPVSFGKFLLLLCGSGVGRDYSDEMMIVDWDYAPNVHPVLGYGREDTGYIEKGSLHPDCVTDFPTFDEAVKSLGGRGYSTHVVEDSREGWAKALELIEYLTYTRSYRDHDLIIDFSQVRAEGSPIKGMQDRPSSGPLPLMRAILRGVSAVKGADLSPWLQTMIVDHYLAECVAMGGVRRCLPKGTLVHTEGGLIPIEGVKPGMRAQTSKGFSPVTGHFSQGKQSVWSIRTDGPDLEATAKHRVAVLTDARGSYSWKRVDELEVGDRLLHTLESIPGKTTKMPPQSEGKRPPTSTTLNEFSVPTEITEDVAWFIGLIHGDGYVVNDPYRKGGIMTACFEEHPEIADRARRVLGRHFDLPAYLYENTGHRAGVVRCHSSSLGEYLEEHVKVAKESIEVPTFILEASREIRAAYLAGVYDADGCPTNKPPKLVTTVYPKFARQLQALYASLGIPVSSYRDKPKKEGWQAQYEIHLRGMRNLFNRVVGVCSSRPNGIVAQKQRRLGFSVPGEMVKEEFQWKHFRRRWDGKKRMNFEAFEEMRAEMGLAPLPFVPVTVQSIEPDVYEEDTFDIEVADEHEFYAQGMLVHNSARIAIKWWKDPEILDFIKVKRSRGLWSANNSVSVDAEFWNLVRLAETSLHTAEKVTLPPDATRAYEIFNAIMDAQYNHATGEPGFLNVDRINQNMTGFKQAYHSNSFMGGREYSVDGHTEKHLLDAIVNVVRTKRYPFIVNPCVTADTWIQTSKGDRQVKDLINTPFDAVVDGKEYSSMGFWKTGYKEVFRVILGSGHFVRCTRDHRIMTDVGWVEAGDLKERDWVRLDQLEFGAVVSLEAEGHEDVYDCTVEEIHAFIANGIYVHNCGEIPLLSLGGFCVLSDVVPFHCDSLDEVKDAMKSAARALIRVNRMDSFYDAEVARTNRIGVGITGVWEFAWKFFGLGFRDVLDEYGRGKDFWRFILEARKETTEEIIRYCGKLGVSIPHTMFTMKPSGSVAKIFGLSEGAHLPARAEYIRYIQLTGKDISEADRYEMLGYPVERNVKNAQGEHVADAIVGFPTRPTLLTMDIPRDKVVLTEDATMEEQFKWVRLLEKYWLGEEYGNQISYTLNFDKSRVDYETYRRTMLDNQPSVRAISLMPTSDWQETRRLYGYSPQTPISADEYEEMVARIQAAEEVITEEELQCQNGGCPL